MTASSAYEELSKYQHPQISCHPGTNNWQQCSLSHQLLPRDEQTKPEDVGNFLVLSLGPQLTFAQDVAYLSPIIAEIEAEMKERADLESMTVQPAKK